VRNQNKKREEILNSPMIVVGVGTHWRIAGRTTPRTGGIGLNESLLYLADLLTTPTPKARVSFI